MALAFFLAFLFTIWHFVWEGILLPTLRQGLRYKLFALRDHLRDIKYSEPESMSDEAFKSFQNYINSSTNVLSYINPYMLIKAKKYVEGRPDMIEFASRTQSLIDSCKHPVVHDILKRTTEYTFRAFVLNIGGWFPILIVPFMLFVMANYCKQKVSRLISLPVGETNRLIQKASWKVAHAA